MTNVTAYFDESIRENVHVVAGYVAPADLWEDFFAPRWRHLLHWATRRSCPLVEFKAGDCAQGKREFQGMPGEDRSAIASAAVDIITETCGAGHLYGVAAVMLHPGLIDPRDRPSSEVTADRYAMDKHGYGHAIGWCFSDAYRIGLEFVGDGTIETVLDRRQGFYAVARRNWEGIRDLVKGDAAKQIAPPVACDSASRYGLQAADLLAYETRAEVWHRFDDWPVSYLLNRLVRTDHHLARVLTLELAHGGKVKELGDTPFLYRPRTHVRSVVLWHGQHWHPAKGRGQRYDRRGLPVEDDENGTAGEDE